MSDRLSRQRIVANGDYLDAMSAPSLDGSGAMLLQTTSEVSYPTSANAFYACNVVSIDGSEDEGSMPSFTAGARVYAYNTGSTVPPEGSYVIGSGVGGRIVFTWDV